jgi:hypothetical protein
LKIAFDDDPIIEERFRVISQYGQVFSDPIALNILGEIAKEDLTSNQIRQNLKLGRKQMYIRLRKLRELKIVQSRGNEYHLTSLGVLINRMVTILGYTISSKHRLLAIDMLGMDIPENERKEIVDVLVPNREIRRLAA